MAQLMMVEAWQRMWDEHEPGGNAGAAKALKSCTP
jgi:hypothetical protein